MARRAHSRFMIKLGIERPVRASLFRLNRAVVLRAIGSLVAASTLTWRTTERLTICATPAFRSARNEEGSTRILRTYVSNL